MKKFLLAVVLLLVVGKCQAQTPTYVAPYQTGPNSGYFYSAPGVRSYYNNGYVYPNRYYQGMNVGGTRIVPYNPAGQVQFNATMLGLAAYQQQQRMLALRYYYYGY